MDKLTEIRQREERATRGVGSMNRLKEIIRKNKFCNCNHSDGESSCDIHYLIFRLLACEETLEAEIGFDYERNWSSDPGKMYFKVWSDKKIVDEGTGR